MSRGRTVRRTFRKRRPKGQAGSHEGAVNSEPLAAIPRLSRCSTRMIWAGWIVLFIGCGLAFTSVSSLSTTVAVYEDSSCSAPAQFVTVTSSLTCTPQVNHYEPTCESGAAGYFVSDCTDYWHRVYDELGIIGDAVGNSYPYLGVAKFTEGKCGISDYRTSVTLYRLDENCYANAAGTASHRLTLNHSATITTYHDAHCTSVASTATVQQRAFGWSYTGTCVDDMIVFYGEKRPDLTAVAVYDDNTCSGVPTQIKFAQDFMCKAPVDGACQDGGSSQYSVQGCTGDFSNFAATRFGTSNPYVIRQDFPNPWCYDMEYATAFSADGLCHTNPDGTTSFKVTINTDSTASVKTYTDSACTTVESDTDLDSGALSSSACIRQSCSASVYGCSSRYAVGGLSSLPSTDRRFVVGVYETEVCDMPPAQLTITRVIVCTATSLLCNPIIAGMSGVFEGRECIDYRDTFAETKFGFSPYLMVENYASGTNCQVHDTIRLYAADGKCHLNATDGGYFTITQRVDGAVIVAAYPTSLCLDEEAVVSVLENWYVNTNTCYQGTTVYRTSEAPLALAPVPTTPEPEDPHTPTPTPGEPTTSEPLPWPPSSWTHTPSTQEPAKTDEEKLLEVMFPAWLWDPEPARAFVSDGRPQRHNNLPDFHRRTDR